MSTQEFHNRLNNMDPRVREVILQYSDENVTGRVNDKWFVGCIEAGLIRVAVDVEDFRKMMKEAFPEDSEKDDDHVLQMWNIYVEAYTAGANDVSEMVHNTTHL